MTSTDNLTGGNWFMFPGLPTGMTDDWCCVTSLYYERVWQVHLAYANMACSECCSLICNFVSTLSKQTNWSELFQSNCTVHGDQTPPRLYPPVSEGDLGQWWLLGFVGSTMTEYSHYKSTLLSCWGCRWICNDFLCLSFQPSHQFYSINTQFCVALNQCVDKMWESDAACSIYLIFLC